MKFFLDTANLNEIREAAAFGFADGVTTNPSLIAKEGNVDFNQHIAAICEIVKGPVSAEVTAQDVDGMIREGVEYSKIAPNVVIKCPLTRDGLKATRHLADEGIHVNVTLCFSPAQAILAASLRHPIHVIEAARMGADIATIPFKVIDQLFNHPLTDKGQAQFLADWHKSGRQ